MKLLLDQNISRKLAQSLEPSFPGTSHVYLLGLATASDAEIWEHARTHAYVLVTQDSDFSERVAVYGHPPKVIWLRTGNTSTGNLERLLSEHTKEILAFGEDTKKGCLIIW